jgi:hypothetical protein
MTNQPITNDPTNPPTKQVKESTQHHYDSTAQTSYQPRPKISNRTAHLGITIRWNQEPGQIRQRQSITRQSGVDLGREVRSC